MTKRRINKIRKVAVMLIKEKRMLKRILKRLETERKREEKKRKKNFKNLLTFRQTAVII